ncbi:unnamed protein product [Effrenium voratum]|uniref:SET domain-containing protein n=1 Tax=Effrenium voratum TaxID=2562239 RepID=A0AA36N4X4_9DINO|nr:unnamed protein product [Effrenium voratum]CAJ1459501.1 unnamed protein product [Effrenium voratum]
MFAASFVPAWRLCGAGVGMTSATRVTGTGSGLGGSGGSGTWSAWKPLLALGIAKCGRSRGRAARGLQALAEVVEISAEVGLGLVSPQGAKAGAVLIEEDPLLQTSKDERLPESAARFRTLPQGTKQKLLALAATPGQAEKEVGFSGDELRFVRVLRTNSVSVPGAGGAVYKTACRANHSCRPNASLCVGPDARMRLKALRDIEPGEDIQVSYIGEGDLLRPTQHRQKQLASWGFKCGCVRCSGPEDTRAFTCAACGTGLMHYEKSEVSGHRWGPCSCCQAVLPAETLRGAEEQWLDHVQSLRPESQEALAPVMAAAMYEGLCSSLAEGGPTAGPALEGHWVSAKLARLAAEELVRQRRYQEAREAAAVLRSYVRRTLGSAATRATAFATYIEAWVLAETGDPAALQLAEQAAQEADLLPRSGDQLRIKVEEVKDLARKVTA